MAQQEDTVGVPIETVMRTAAFAAGVADRRAGVRPRFDEFEQNDAWWYELGRLWASIAPVGMSLKTGNKLNQKAVAVFRAAMKKGWLR